MSTKKISGACQVGPYAKSRAVRAAFHFQLLIGTLFLCAIHAGAAAESTRQSILKALEEGRNSSFSSFLQQHGQQCSVNESQFGLQVNRANVSGDVWWVRCESGKSFAIFIDGDSRSTAWYMPCESVTRLSNLMCFRPPPNRVAVK